MTLPYTLLLPPLISIILRTLTAGRFNYLPAGPTPILFSLLAQYHAAIPFMYQYRIGLAPFTGNTGGEASQRTDSTITFTSKSTNYFLPLQLALSQFPATLLPAAVGWIVGYSYRLELIPGTRWRVPRWMVGQSRVSHGKTKDVAELRRRLEVEATPISATGIEASSSGGRRRG